MFLTICMHLYSIVETVSYVVYEAISNKSVIGTEKEQLEEIQQMLNLEEDKTAL